MKINSITRLIIMSAMTCFSTAALADVTPHSNTDSVDFAANMTVQGKQCPLTVTKTGDVGFTYTYTQHDADTDAPGTMTIDSPEASVTVTTSNGCQLHGVKIDTPSRTGLIKVATDTAALPTRNGGFVPFVAQLANVTFSDGVRTTTARSDMDKYTVYTVTDRAPSTDLYFGSTVVSTQINGVNVPGISGLSGGFLRFNGSPNFIPSVDYVAIRDGMADIKGPTNSPESPGHHHGGYADQYYSWAPASLNTAEYDNDFKATEAVFTFTAMVGTTVYSLADKLPDPSAVYDNESLSTTVTYTFTAI